MAAVSRHDEISTSDNTTFENHIVFRVCLYGMEITGYDHKRE